VTTPVARALIGKTAGMSVEVEPPGGTKVYRMRKVEWLVSAETRTRSET
jgi:transcription elongation factor GreA